VGIADIHFSRSAKPNIFPTVNFPVIAYEFEANGKLDESLAASWGNHKASQ
jgi:hypothetical protein